MFKDICNIEQPQYLGNEGLTYSGQLIMIFVRKKKATDGSCFPSDPSPSTLRCLQLGHAILLALESRGVVMRHDIPTRYRRLTWITFRSKCRSKTKFIYVSCASLFMAVMTFAQWLCACACVGVASFETFLFGGLKKSLKTSELASRLLICCTAIGSGAAQTSNWSERWLP